MGLPATSRSSLVAYFMAGALALLAVAVSCGGGETSSMGGSAGVAAPTPRVASTAAGVVATAEQPGKAELRDALLGVPRRERRGAAELADPRAGRDAAGAAARQLRPHVAPRRRLPVRGDQARGVSLHDAGAAERDAGLRDADSEIVEVIEYIKGFWGSDERSFRRRLAAGTRFLRGGRPPSCALRTGFDGLRVNGGPHPTAPLDSCLRRNDDGGAGAFDGLRANGGPHPTAPLDSCLRGNCRC